MDLASRGDRLVGQLIDTAIAFAPFFMLAILATDPASDQLGVYGGVTMIFGIGYYLFADALPGGQSVGKQMLGIAVVDQYSRRPCTVFQSFGRNLVAPILGALDWIFILGGDRQRLGDKLAGTIVVERERVYAEPGHP